LGSSVSEMLRQKLRERLANLKAAIDENGKEGAVAYARNAFGSWPKHGGNNETRKILLDAALRLRRLRQRDLIALLSSEATYYSTKEWIESKLPTTDRTIISVAKKLGEGRIKPKTRTGPKEKSDGSFQFIAWQISEDLAAIGVPRHIGGERSKKKHKFSASEVIAEAVRKENEPLHAKVSPSLARDWIKAAKPKLDK